jgi:transcriptional regulator with XRE-family HTH domain
MARAALQIGVRELADIADVSPMTITRFENGHSGGHAATLRKLQAALDRIHQWQIAWRTTDRAISLTEFAN